MRKYLIQIEATMEAKDLLDAAEMVASKIVEIYQNGYELKDLPENITVKTTKMKEE